MAHLVQVQDNTHLFTTNKVLKLLWEPNPKHYLMNKMFQDREIITLMTILQPKSILALQWEPDITQIKMKTLNNQDQAHMTLIRIKNLVLKLVHQSEDLVKKNN